MATNSIQEENNLETVYLIWLDGSVNSSNENLDAQRQFQSIINYLKTFSNVQDCEKYLQQISQQDRIFLIVSGRLGQEIVPKIHHLRQICSIYVYCMDKKMNENWAKNFFKIKGVITNLDDLLKQIQLDQIKRRENLIDEPLTINITLFHQVPDQSTKKINGEFVNSQLLIDCLIRMKSNKNDKQELIKFCQQIYKNNSKELNIIKEFEENYTSKNALWWYTRESFLYRLLNKALRIQNIDLLYLFRFFLSDIEKQLKQLQCKSTSVCVYRGQLMSKDELKQLENSVFSMEYISINSFFSTSLNQEQARKFLNDYSCSTNLEKVLFKIFAGGDEKDRIKSFANISSKSFYSNEYEILFMIGSVFRLMDIKQENNIWIIQMIVADNDENFKILFNNIKNEYSGINDEPSILSFANILHNMGKYDLAEKYFHQCLKILPNNHDDISKCYHALGIISLIKDNYDLSLQWHEKSLKILSINDLRLADSYNCIGCIYQKKQEFSKSLEFYNKALEIWKNSFGDDYYKIADCLNNMGCVYEIEKNYSIALEYHQKALLIRQKNLPKNHPDLGGSYNNIGNIYFYLEQYDLALENYQYSYEIKLQSLPSQHLSLASTLENIALVYEQKQLFSQALIYYEKALKIFRDTFSSKHAHIIEIEQDIQRLSTIINTEKLETTF